MFRIAAEAEGRAFAEMQLDAALEVNRAGEEIARRDDDASSSGSRAGVDGLADGIGRKDLAIAARAVFCDVEIAGGELRRADAFQDRVFIGSRIGSAGGDRCRGGRRKSRRFISDSSKQMGREPLHVI